MKQRTVLALLCTMVLSIPALADSKYKRKDWPHWSDLNHNCLNTRHELLRDRSEKTVKFKPRDTCRVISGQWTDPYSGKLWYRADDVDIDHMIPLKWAHDHGGAAWTRSRREQFANDLRNLIIVEDDLNHQKGAKGPDEWLPPKNRCWYKQQWESLIRLYRLDAGGLNLTCTAADKRSQLDAEHTDSPHASGSFSCETSKRYCRQMSSCQEAEFYLNVCKVKTLDGDKDGTPCEALCR